MILQIINGDARSQILRNELESRICYPEIGLIKLYKISLILKNTLSLVEIEAPQVFSESVIR
jgi:hypothetical protein